jgi:hypothetical protein
MLQQFSWAIKHGNGETEQGKLISESADNIRQFLSFSIPSGSVITAITPDEQRDTGNMIVLNV